MKKYNRHRTAGEILLQCRQQKVPIDLTRWLKGSDFIRIGDPDTGVFGWVIYNTFNGRFYGRTPQNGVGHHGIVSGDSFVPAAVTFSSDSNARDHDPWFQKLLDFFYTDAPYPTCKDRSERAIARFIRENSPARWVATAPLEARR